MDFSNLAYRPKFQLPGLFHQTPQPVIEEPSAIIKQEPEDEKKYTPAYVPDDFDEVYATNGTAKRSPSPEVVATRDRRVPTGEVVVVPDDDEDYEPPPATVSREARQIPGFANLAFRPSTAPLSSMLSIGARRDVPHEVNRVDTPQMSNQLPSLPTLDHDSLFLAPTTQRALDGDRQPAGTVCFEGPFASKPHHHRLICGHTVQTDGIVPCGMNCKQSVRVDKKPRGREFRCFHKACQDKQDRAKLPFMQKKNAAKPRRTKAGHVFGYITEEDEAYNANVINGFGGMDMDKEPVAPKNRYGLRRRSRSPTRTQTPLYRDRTPLRAREQHDFAMSGHQPSQERNTRYERELRRLDIDGTAAFGFTHATEAMRVKAAILAATPMSSPQEMSEAQELQERNARFDRELKRLGIDGTAAFGFADAREKARMKGLALATAPTANTQEMSDVPDDRRRRPHHYARGGLRNQHAEMYSMDEETYTNMIADEGGVVVEHEDDGRERFVRHDGRFDRDNQDEPVGEDDGRHYHDETAAESELFCVCRAPADDYLISCEKCDQLFHPDCIGKGIFDGDDKLRLDATRYRAQKVFFTCQACDRKLAASLQAHEIYGETRDGHPRTSLLHNLRRKAKAKWVDDLELQKMQKTNRVAEMKVLLKRAGNDSVTRKLIYERFQPLLRQEDHWNALEAELFGESNDGQSTNVRATRNTTRAATTESVKAAVEEIFDKDIICDGEGCGKKISGIYYVPMDADWVGWDFCDECIHMAQVEKPHQRFRLIEPVHLQHAQDVKSIEQTGKAKGKESGAKKAAMQRPQPAPVAHDAAADGNLKRTRGRATFKAKKTATPKLASKRDALRNADADGNFRKPVLKDFDHDMSG